MESKAEEKKALGNEEFKRGNYHKAIKFYTEALECKPSEAIYTNRAASYIQLKEFKKAQEDCNLALNLNPNFGKAYKRLFKIYLSLGNLDKAKESIQKAIQLDPADKTNINDQKLLEDIQAKERVIVRSIENKDFSTAVSYISQILQECIASENHSIQKIQLLLKASQLKEAVDFSRELMLNPIFNKNPAIVGWRGKLLVYNGEDVEGKKVLMNALNLDPDNQDLKNAVKNIKKQHDLKEEASELFKHNKYQEAVDKFKECLEIDPMNLNYNATILLNIGIALNKLKKNEEALVNLNKAIQLNPQYAKALVKRGEVNQALENHEDALRDFQAASHIDPNGFGVQEKIKYAKQKAKEAQKKDYYKILGVDKNATEDDIKKAYKKLALKWHPDRNQQSEEQKAKADKMFKDVNEAYTVLSDPQKRKRFDMGGFDPTDPDGGMSGNFASANIDPNEIFKMFFSQSSGGGGAGGMGGGMPFFSFGGMEDDMFAGFGGNRGSQGSAGRGRGGAGGPGGFGGFPGFSFMSGGGGNDFQSFFSNMHAGGAGGQDYINLKMFPTPSNTMEKIKQQEFLKNKIREAFNIVDQERKGIVDKREISYLMRYLLQFPSEAQVRDYIIPQLEDDEPSDYIKYEKFEPYMLQVLSSKFTSLKPYQKIQKIENEFEPHSAEHLLAAFRILDPEGKGYIKKDVMHQLLTTKGIQLRPTEYEFFKQFALDKTGQYIYYEDYLMEKLSTTKSGSIVFTQEPPETQVESFKKAKQVFQEQEKKNLMDQIEDLNTSLEINKGIICDLLQCKSLQQVEGAIINKLNDENSLLRIRIKSLYQELDDGNAQLLLIQQICNEQKVKEQENAQIYEEQLIELKDKLERKEYFMQSKEKKWMEVEKILEEYAEEDDELREKLYELRVNVFSNKKITNVVEENEKLKLQLDEAHDEISRLRKQVLLMGLSGPKTPQPNKAKSEFCTIQPQKHGIVNEEEQEDGYCIEEKEDFEEDQYNNQVQTNKKAFMSTAPINFHKANNLGSRYKLKIKESKEELKQYSHQLEEALAKLRQKFIEIEKDHEILNKTYLKELKKGDRMQQVFQKVKQFVTSLTINGQNGKLCHECLQIQEINDLKKIIRERVFETSNEGEQLTLEGLEMSFNKNENRNKKQQNVVISRGQVSTPVTRSRQNNLKLSNGGSTKATSQSKIFNFAFNYEPQNRISNIIPEEELDAKDENNQMYKSPFLVGDLEYNKISAIGMNDMTSGRQTSPFWDQEQIHEFQNSLSKNFKHQQHGQGGYHRGKDSEINDEFRR